MKFLLIIALLALFVGCDGLTPISAYSKDIGEFRLLINDSITVGTGEYQAGFQVLASGVVSSFTTGGILLNGNTTYSISTSGEYWILVNTGAMTAGDIGTIETTIIKENYYLEEGPEYETFILEIEVE